LVSLQKRIRERENSERRSVSRILFPLVTEEGNDHSSGHVVADMLKRPNPEGWSEATLAQEGPLLFGLAPGGVYPTPPSLEALVRSYLHLFTLTGSTR